MVAVVVVMVVVVAAAGLMSISARRSRRLLSVACRSAMAASIFLLWFGR